MKIRLLVLCMLGGFGAIASAQTCHRKCDASCTQAFTNPHQVEQCKLDCYKRNCDVSTPPQTAPPPPPRPWDVVASKGGLDTNGFFRNPQWWWGLTTGGTSFDVCDFCPCGVNSPELWSEDARCTNQSLHINQGNPLCGGYHMNWFPVEVDGSLRFEDHEPSIAGDNDYEFDILGPDNNLVTANRSDVHLEFNASETVDDWDGTGTWWEYFHHQIVDKYWNNKLYRQQWFGNRVGIVIGMLGVDEEHADHHSELHPMYIMFIKMPGPDWPPAQIGKEDHWTFFVRNWGNEGYCGPGDEPLADYRQLQVQLPEKVLLASNVWVYAHGAATLFADEYSIDQCAAESNMSISPDGLLTFDLPPAYGKCGFVGDLTMGSEPLTVLAAATGPTAQVLPSRTHVGEDAEEALAARVNILDPAARRELEKQVAELTKPAGKNSTIRQIKLAELTQAPSPTKRPLAATRTFKAVVNPAWQDQERKKRQIINGFLKAHGIQ